MRVAVTTTADGFERWAAPLRAMDLMPICLPCIEVRAEQEPALVEARRLARESDLILITSARAVRLLWPEGGMPTIPAAVVGEATARAVDEAGGSVAVRGGGDGDDLVDLLVEGVAGERIFFPSARAADPSRARRLTEAGARVETRVVYTTVPIAPGSDPVEAAVFGSPTSVEGWLRSRELAGLELVAAMGTTTAHALREKGRQPDVVPTRPSVEAIARDLALNVERIP